MFHTRVSIDITTAMNVANAAFILAEQRKLMISVAISDCNGNLLYYRRHHGSFLASGKCAQAKSRTAVEYQRSTQQMSDRLSSGRLGYITLPDVVILPGGIPIFSNLECIGGIGVSGATAEEDNEIAMSALNILQGQ